MKLIWHPLAMSDRERILDFIARGLRRYPARPPNSRS